MKVEEEKEKKWNYKYQKLNQKQHYNQELILDILQLDLKV